MPKPVLGLILGAILGVLDGFSALFYPEAAPQITEIVFFSTLKSLIAGVIIGFYARKVDSIGKGVLFGGVVGLIFAFLVALAPDESGNHYFIEIMVPGGIIGLILGFATQKYGSKKPQTA
ncbi:hypothetical protein GWO43_13890 [candidate division KSB1 bacterium]|nr:hypothetical protein [candidate division KSB1 bacterium]NIR72106.1 hypothetical protein [candidate division KSB1 bacterium]NIS26048.1 hypothetical protein [candidate division KSB1 bacterium]NIT71939.1 hypothetical protein [candidate division KSB1 bacterium]NIU25683.1 hypothetical protein [candidate division KSB1 bacterium]